MTTNTAIDTQPHSGIVKPRTAPELSDVLLFVIAAFGVVIVRRALRARFAKRRDTDTPKD
jgi:hypothetical protein